MLYAQRCLDSGASLVIRHSGGVYVRHEKLSPALSGKRHAYLLIVCAAVVALCCAQAALAQSGRRHKSSASPPPPPPPVSVEPKPEPEIDPSAVKTPVPISSVIVMGDLIQSGSSRSNRVDQAVDACVERLKERQVIEAVGSGSRKRAAAMERAKSETDAYVLWLEINIDDDVRTDRGVYVERYISSVNYYVFMPQTAEILTKGRVYPRSQDIKHGGVILRLPTSNTRLPLTYELRDVGRQVADRVRDSFVKIRPSKTGN
jgi:hypothetical protein